MIIEIDARHIYPLHKKLCETLEKTSVIPVSSISYYTTDKSKWIYAKITHLSNRTERRYWRNKNFHTMEFEKNPRWKLVG